MRHTRGISDFHSVSALGALATRTVGGGALASSSRSIDMVAGRETADVGVRDAHGRPAPVRARSAHGRTGHRRGIVYVCNFSYNYTTYEQTKIWQYLMVRLYILHPSLSLSLSLSPCARPPIAIRSAIGSLFGHMSSIRPRRPVVLRRAPSWPPQTSRPRPLASRRAHWPTGPRRRRRMCHAARCGTHAAFPLGRRGRRP